VAGSLLLLPPLLLLLAQVDCSFLTGSIYAVLATNASQCAVRLKQAGTLSCGT
jgi:hypothetical protein